LELGNKADIKKALKAVNNAGLAPVHLAINTGRVKPLQLLLKVNEDQADFPEPLAGKHPLHMAVEQNLLAVCGELLLKGNLDIDAQTFSGQTALHLAVMNNNHLLASLLISADADPLIRNSEPDDMYSDDPDGCTPMDLAAGDTKMLSILQDLETFTPFTDARPLFGHHNEAFFVPEKNPVSGQTYTSLVSQKQGDLHRLPLSERYEIGELLDRNPSQRRELADAFDMGCLYKTLEEAVSPGRAILDCFEAFGVYMEPLSGVLKNLGLSKAAEIVDSHLSNAKTSIGVKTNVGGLVPRVEGSLSGPAGSVLTFEGGE
jgi:hypothetical protein